MSFLWTILIPLLASFHSASSRATKTNSTASDLHSAIALPPGTQDNALLQNFMTAYITFLETGQNPPTLPNDFFKGDRKDAFFLGYLDVTAFPKTGTVNTTRQNLHTIWNIYPLPTSDYHENGGKDNTPVGFQSFIRLSPDRYNVDAAVDFAKREFFGGSETIKYNLSLSGLAYGAVTATSSDPDQSNQYLLVAFALTEPQS